VYFIRLKIEATGPSEFLSSHEDIRYYKIPFFWDTEPSHWLIVSWLFDETMRFRLQRPDVREEFDMYTLEDESYTVLLKVAN
jgi:hypothetical protein